MQHVNLPQKLRNRLEPWDMVAYTIILLAAAYVVGQVWRWVR